MTMDKVEIGIKRLEYSCPYCLKSYKGPIGYHNLENHVRIYHSEKQADFQKMPKDTWEQLKHHVEDSHPLKLNDFSKLNEKDIKSKIIEKTIIVPKMTIDVFKESLGLPEASSELEVIEAYMKCFSYRTVPNPLLEPHEWIEEFLRSHGENEWFIELMSSIAFHYHKLPTPAMLWDHMHDKDSKSFFREFGKLADLIIFAYQYCLDIYIHVNNMFNRKCKIHSFSENPSQFCANLLELIRFAESSENITILKILKGYSRELWVKISNRIRTIEEKYGNIEDNDHYFITNIRENQQIEKAKSERKKAIEVIEENLLSSVNEASKILNRIRRNIQIFSSDEMDQIHLQLKALNRNFFIISNLDKKEFRLTGEEVIRQLWINRLINKHNIPIDKMYAEKEIKIGTFNTRADLVLTGIASEISPIIVFEFKAPDVNDEQQGIEQLKSYCNAINAPSGILSNGQYIIRLINKGNNNFDKEILENSEAIFEK